MRSNLQVLQYQQIVRGREWEEISSDPLLKEKYLLDYARQKLAEAMAEKGLVRFVTSEPDPKSDDPMRHDCAVIRGSVAVATDKDEVAQYALQLAEAETRGFNAALKAMQEVVATLLGRKADPYVHYASRLVDDLADGLRRNHEHRPAADWRPMNARPGYGERLEYLFANGKVHREPTMVEPRRLELPASTFAPDAVAEIVADRFDAIAWRHAGRPPYMEPRL